MADQKVIVAVRKTGGADDKEAFKKELIEDANMALVNAIDWQNGKPKAASGFIIAMHKLLGRLK